MVATVAAMLGVEISESAGMRPGFPINSPKALFDEGGGKGDTALRLFALNKAGAAAELTFKQTKSSACARGL